MKQIFLVSIGLFILTGSFAWAAAAKKELKADPFSVSTEDLDDAESLNRIAGNYDNGFSSPENTFKANDHAAGAGPFARQKAESSKD